MDFTAYITLCLILVAPSCHSIREERAVKRAWPQVTEDDLKKDYKYFALLMYGTEYCSGTITSTSTVLTYCPQDPKMAYAGLLKPGDIKDESKTNKQQSNVQTVKKDKLNDFRICIVENKWNLTDYVGVVALHVEDSLPDEKTCNVLGFDKTNGVHKLEKQTIGARSLCKIGAPSLEADETLLYSEAATDNEALATGDQGGPAVCGVGDKAKLWGITVKAVTGNKRFRDTATCNTYIKISHYSDWIKENSPQDSAENQGPNGNNTVASTGSSIHGYMKKNSEWKVLGFLVPIIVTFLQY